VRRQQVHTVLARSRRFQIHLYLHYPVPQAGGAAMLAEEAQTELNAGAEMHMLYQAGRIPSTKMAIWQGLRI
jgi:hypothetical protein